VVDVSKEIVALTSAENLFEMNVDTLKTVNQIQQNLIDSWAEFFELPDVAGVL
jgi:flagellar basal body rod protein FlgC